MDDLFPSRDCTIISGQRLLDLRCLSAGGDFERDPRSFDRAACRTECPKIEGHIRPQGTALDETELAARRDALDDTDISAHNITSIGRLWIVHYLKIVLINPINPVIFLYDCLVRRETMSEEQGQQRRLIACAITELVPAEFFLRQEVVTALHRGWSDGSRAYPTFYRLREGFCRQLGYEGQRHAIVSGHERVYLDYMSGAGRTMGHELLTVPDVSMLERNVIELHAANVRTIGDYRTRIMPEADYIRWLGRKSEKERREIAR